MQSAVVRMSRSGARWAIALVAVAILFLPLAAGSSAAATGRQVEGGSLTWGAKESFRTYVTGFIARGEITPADGASQAADNGPFTFTGGTGTVRTDGGADLAFDGSVTFSGHHGDLDVTIADPELTLDATGAGHLVVQHTLEGTTTSVDIADVSDADIAVDGDTATLQDATVTLTEAGRAVFSMDGTAGSSFYTAGEELDPVSIEVALVPAATDPEPTDPPTTEPTDPPTVEAPTTPKPTPPTGTSGQLVWGVKSSFRSYVGGPVAQGTVTTSGHARTAADGSYVFPQRSTSAAPPSAQGTTSYRGQVGFAGHHGDLDLTLRNPRVVVTSSTSARLVVDSRPTGASGFSTVTVSALDLTKGAKSSAQGAVTHSDVPVTLSPAGTRLFSWGGSSMYPAGTAMDPVTFTVGTDTTVSGSGDTSTTQPKGSSTSSSGTTDGSSTSAGTPSAGAAAPATTGSSVGAGSLTWGVRTSFRDYITGPIAHGSISVSGGAGSSGSAFTFPQSGGAKGDGGADYRGAVTFRGHGGILSMSLSNPSVRIDSTRSAALTAQVSGQRMTIATLNLAASATAQSGGATTYSAVPATLTAQGSTMFVYNGSSFYPAGTAMDPVSFTVGSASSAAAGGSSAAPQTVASATGTSSSSASTAVSRSTTARRAKVAPDACVATGSNLTWGFKESFRSYVSGSIAGGDWSASRGASYSTPSFTWAKGTGSFDERTRTGSVDFPGAVAFSGHDGALNTTISDPQVQIEGDRALIVLDVEGASMDAAMEGRDDSKSVPDVPFVEVDLSQATVETKGGRTTITATDAPTALTSQGEAAFSTYTAGTSFDPVSFTITAKSSCLAPTKTATGAPSGSNTAAAAMSGPSGSDSLSGWTPWIGGAGLGAATAAGTILLLGRRRPEVTA